MTILLRRICWFRSGLLTHTSMHRTKSPGFLFMKATPEIRFRYYDKEPPFKGKQNRLFRTHLISAVVNTPQEQCRPY